MLLLGLPDKHPLFSLISYMVSAYNFDSFPKCFTSDTNKYFIFMLFKYLKINTRQRGGGGLHDSPIHLQKIPEQFLHDIYLCYI